MDAVVELLPLMLLILREVRWQRGLAVQSNLGPVSVKLGNDDVSIWWESLL